MRALLASVSWLSVCASTLLLSGCKVETLTQFTGSEQVDSEDYVDGANVVIDGLYGSITVQKGSAG
ncbi:MAG TPA: hypothetical protein VIW29_21270, partial [Polyangiaceae bacterium]